MDYKQELITTVHDFGRNLEPLSERLTELSQREPTALIIPALYAELERPALTNIRNHLQNCPFISRVIISLYADNAEQYASAVRFFAPLPQQTLVLWENGAGVAGILEELKDRNLDLTAYRGKGRAVWLALGIATLEARAIALHDADIVTYDASYPLKLLYPLLEPGFGLAFVKAYYARIGSESRCLYGRVARLFLTPVLDALIELFGSLPYLRYLSAYRYPLSGEFALNSDLALNMRFPGNWGLEVGMLAEVYRNVATKRVAQIDLGVFDHKHQALGNSSQQGLQKMCRDILQSILQTLTEMERVTLSYEDLRALRVKYCREAQDFIRQYFVDASFNGLIYDRHQEELTVDLFEQVVLEAGTDYLEAPIRSQIPDWTRALAALPTLRESLLEVTQAEMAGAVRQGVEASHSA
ncbi:glucosyl-3-phosphoglycerate synthase [Leptolyngbya sp. FACHB-261]|uniref:glucosyl-3-phosphoglycerate synthase n=1 Tax=Leptolyngbya sp. FACHB-261 TaxID=2692806 RepID=UPI001685C22D|nr:glucosyl-3-phosphoglycerate synthase [Leptolyngbya sp. FACHB-261]MBD2103787.1 glucosyl-3-phosphoglycerate synthase [Leptolyngbya sp. FACHB-261]